MDKSTGQLYKEFEIAVSDLWAVMGDFSPGAEKRFSTAVRKVKTIKAQIWTREKAPVKNALEGAYFEQKALIE